MAQVEFKYLKSGTLTESQKTSLANAIVFVEQECAIYTHGQKYGIDPTDAAKITNLETAVEALKKVKHFGGVKVGTQTWVPATDGASLEVTGGGGTSVKVADGKLTITSTDYTSSIADAKKAGTDAASALNTYKSTNDTAVAAAKSAADAAQSSANSKVASVGSGSQAITIAGTATAPTVGLKLDTTGNVALSQSTAGLKASITIPEATVTGIKSADPILTLSNKLISADVTLDYVKGDKKIYLYGKDKTTAISSVAVDDFLVDGILDDVTLTGNTLTFTWNTASGKTAKDIDLSKFMDNVNFDGATLLLKSLPTVTTYTAPKNGDSIDKAISNLAKGIADAKSLATTSGVTSFGGQTGEITVRGGQSANGSINLSMSGKQLQASIQGLGTAAYTASTAYATSAQGSKADSAIQAVSGTAAQYITASTNASKGVTVGATIQSVANASSTSKGLAEASDVKSYIDTQLTWEEL